MDCSLSVIAGLDHSAHRDALASSTLAATAANTGHYGGPGGVVPQKLEEITDNFNYKNTDLWSGWTGGADTVNGTLVMPVSGGGSIYTTTGNIHTGAGVYDLNNSYVVIHLIQPPNTDDSTPYARLEVRPQYSTLDSSNQSAIRIDYIAGSWKFRQLDASGTPGQVSTASYSSAGGWVKIRVNGDMAYWDTSDNGVDWNVAHEEELSGFGYHASSVSISVSPGDSLDPGTAIWDQFNSIPRPIQAFLSVSVSTDTPETVASRHQTIESGFSAEAVGVSGEGRYDAIAQAELVLTSFLMAEIVRTVYASVGLDIAAAVPVDGTEFGTADASTGVSIESPASMVSDQLVSAYLNAQASATTLFERTQYAEALLESIGLGSANAIADYPAQASLAVYAFPTAIALRTAYASGSLGLSADTSSIGTEYGIADSALAVGASQSAAASRTQYLEALTGAFFTIYASISNNRIAAAMLAANAYHTVDADEPWAIVRVRADNRTARVATQTRRSAVRAERRVAVVPAANRRAT